MWKIKQLVAADKKDDFVFQLPQDILTPNEKHKTPNTTNQTHN